MIYLSCLQPGVCDRHCWGDVLGAGCLIQLLLEPGESGHRLRKWFGLDGAFHSTPLYGQGHFPLDHVAPSRVLPGFVA